MENSILNEINNIKFLFKYDRSKTLNEQPEPTGSTQTSSGATQTPVPTPTPQASSTTPEVPQASSTTPEVPQEYMSSSRIELGTKNDPYQYKFEDDGNVQKYYYAKKGQNDWKQSTNPKSVEAIKRNVFKIR
jgi:hypothetical protein